MLSMLVSLRFVLFYLYECLLCFPICSVSVVQQINRLFLSNQSWFTLLAIDSEHFRNTVADFVCHMFTAYLFTLHHFTALRINIFCSPGASEGILLEVSKHHLNVKE